MWLFFGLGAILLAGINVTRAWQGKDAEWFRFLNLSFTALTLCAFYSNAALRVSREDWAGLMDILPSMHVALWICTVASILINSLSLFKEKKEGNDL